MTSESTGITEIINARRTESADAVVIQKLITDDTNAVFGHVSLMNLIERALLAITLTNLNDEVLAHGIFLDYPDLDSVPKGEWEAWMKEYFDFPKVDGLNTLFMRHYASMDEYELGAAKEIVRTAFNAVPSAHYIFLVAQPGGYPNAGLEKIFNPAPKNGDKAPNDCALFVCYRHEFMPTLYIRHAQVEDQDDLTPIFNKQSDVLRKTYGDFFLAELIESQNPKMHCLAAEVEGTAIGFMSVSDAINIDVLNKCFELTPFHGLRKPHPDDILTKPEEPVEEVPSQVPSQESSRPQSTVSEHGQAESPAPSSTVSEQISPEDKVKEQGAEETVVQQKSSSSLASEAEPCLPEHTGGELSTPSEHSTPRESHDTDDEVVQSEVSEQEEPAGVEEVPPEISRITPVPPPNTAAAAQQLHRFHPTFCGEANACVIQLFAMDERYEMRALDFMPKVFELFPQADFAVITVPALVPEFPLLQHFVRVTPRFNSTLNHELYVFHKAGLISNFRVRKACKSDTEGVQKLVHVLHLGGRLMEDFAAYNSARRDKDGTEIQAFVAECMGQVVGICILRSEEKIEYLRAHFAIEDFIYFNHHQRQEHGHIYHLAVNPIFTHLTKTFIKEIMRFGEKTSLYYPIHPPYAPKELQQEHTLITALNDMVAVRARRQIVYPLDKLQHNAPSERILVKYPPVNLAHVNRKLILEPKVTINARIVVVGASTAGLSFLETLTFCPHLRFNNLTLVSPHGIPGDLPPDELRDTMMATDHCYTQEDFALVSLRTRVNVVYGKMTAINRKKKHLTVNGSYLVPFDHLILATGLQHQVPLPIALGDNAFRRFLGKCAKNLFTVNDQYDAAVFLHWVESQLLNKDYTSGAPDKHIVIYGHTLQSFCTVETLVQLGLPGKCIMLVEPHAPQVSVFNNPTVEKAVNDALAELEVTVIKDQVLYSWNNGEESPEVLTSVEFINMQKETTSVPCMAFLSFYEPMVDLDSFKAINDACIVFDGRLVVDSNFHTNDVSIRGLGPLTKYQRKYHVEGWSHTQSNTKIVGEQLAHTMLRLFDPVMEPLTKPPTEEVTLVPIYEGAKIQGGILPGGYHYLHAAKPAIIQPFKEFPKEGADQDLHLVTGSPLSEEGYFLIHVNQHRMIETITCIAKKEFPVSNLLCLYGLHERLLNNLVSRYQEGIIPDLYEFFRQSWCMAIFHDRFRDFKDEIRELLMTEQELETQSIEAKVRAMVEEDMGLSDLQREVLRDDYRLSGRKTAVEQRLLSFISYNNYHLPMYAKPSMV